MRQARPQKVGAHRALDDIRDSIDELRYYREKVFVPADLAGDEVVDVVEVVDVAVEPAEGGDT